MSTDSSFSDFLRESFDVLRREMPDLHLQMCRRLARREVELSVGNEVVGLVFSDDDLAFREGERAADAPPPNIDVKTSRRVILGLIDAETTMIDAVLGDRLFLRGGLGELVRFHDGLRIYLHGAMRAPSFRDILRRFRDA